MNEDFGVAYIKENDLNLVKVTASNFKNRVYIHIREYQYDEYSYKTIPTKSGYAIWEEGLDSVIELLLLAQKKVSEFRYYNPRQLSLALEGGK